MPYTLLELHSITGVEIDDRVGFVIHVDPLATQNILSFTVYLNFFSCSSLEWRLVSPLEQKRLAQTALDDGEFW